MSLYNQFIGDIWIGRSYTFGTGTVAIIVLNNYLTGLRIPLITMKNAAGKYLEDTWIPFGFASVNLVASIFLAKPFGVAGVFLGTIIGSLFTADWYRPVVIYRTVFHAPVEKVLWKVLFIFDGWYRLYCSHLLAKCKNLSFKHLFELCDQSNDCWMCSNTANVCAVPQHERIWCGKRLASSTDRRNQEKT